MHRLIFLSAFLLLATVSAATSSAAIILNIPLDNDAGAPAAVISGNVFSISYLNLVDEGVSFTATLTVTGSEAHINHAAGGLGVGPNPGDNTLQDGESVRFTMSISNMVNGTVLFTGFSSVFFNTGSFTSAANDGATISNDDLLVTVGDNFYVTGGTDFATLTGNPTAFTVFGGPIPTSTDFQLLSVVANFSGIPTAIPEPRFAVVAAMLFTLLLAVRRAYSTL